MRSSLVKQKFPGPVPLRQLLSCFTALAALAAASTVPSVGPLNASLSSIKNGTSTSVKFTTQITGISPMTSGVNLLQEDASGKTLGILGVMHDDGLNGDAVAGDGVYTLVVSLDPPSQTTKLYLQVSAAFKGSLMRARSSVLQLPVTASSASSSPRISQDRRSNPGAE